ncbi:MULTISPECIES: FXSXX-COOH protein [unclassified Streptomyces]|uniref:FXSXX-COOH protein n=1 Tax=unclassified Streptomyces TaxID=2593676 RepID=UPI003808E5EB
MKTSVNSASFAVAKNDRVSLAELVSKGVGRDADKSLSRVLPTPPDGRPTDLSTFNSSL